MVAFALIGLIAAMLLPRGESPGSQREPVRRTTLTAPPLARDDKNRRRAALAPLAPSPRADHRFRHRLAAVDGPRAPRTDAATARSVLLASAKIVMVAAGARKVADLSGEGLEFFTQRQGAGAEV